MGPILGLTHTHKHRCQLERHLALIQTMRWWADVAAGLSTPLDQFGVSHTSQRGYLPFSGVQKGDKMKESSHLIKGKRKKTRHGHQAYKTGLKRATLPSLPMLTHTLSVSQSVTTNADVYKALREALQKNKDEYKHGMVPAPKELTV